MSRYVSVEIDGKSYAGTLAPVRASADVDLVARYRMGRHGRPLCRGPHAWTDNMPVPNLRMDRPRECAACGARENENEGA